jgi:hypothetical protein
MPTTAWSRSAESGNASSAMNKATVKPDPRQGGSTNELAALYRARQEAEPQPQSQQRTARYSDTLAEEQRHDNPYRHPRAHGCPQRFPIQPNPRIRESEERNAAVPVNGVSVPQEGQLSADQSSRHTGANVTRPPVRNALIPRAENGWQTPFSTAG